MIAKKPEYEWAVPWWETLSDIYSCIVEANLVAGSMHVNDSVEGRDDDGTTSPDYHTSVSMGSRAHSGISLRETF